MRFIRLIVLGSIAAAIALSSLADAGAQQKKATIADFISPAFPSELVSAKKADTIAWIAYERGMRNVYAAAAPDFKPVRLTNFLSDDGNDLTGLSITDDGGVVVFVRGHTPNQAGWIANPTSDPRGSERAIWAVKTTGGEPWKVAVAANPVLAPDGRWIVFVKNGQIHAAPVLAPKTAADADKDDKPLFLAFGTNSNPTWSPDSRHIAFVSNRSDHSFIGVYDSRQTQGHLSGARRRSRHQPDMVARRQADRLHSPAGHALRPAKAGRQSRRWWWRRRQRQEGQATGRAS